MHYSTRSKISILLALIVVLSMSLGLFASAKSGVHAASPTDWPMFGFDPQHTNFNPEESTLSSSNVSNLILAWDTNSNTGAGAPVLANGMIYAGLGCSLSEIDATTGSVMWSNPAIGQCDTPVDVANGIVYTGAGSPDGNYLYAVDASTGAILWTYPIQTSTGTPPTVVNGIVYISDDNGNLYAINASTGTLVWSGSTNYYRISPTVVNGVLYDYAPDGNLDALDPQTGTLLWSFATGSNVGGNTPSIVNNVLYLSTSHTVDAINLKTHTLIWSYPDTSLAFRPQAVANGVVYIGSAEGTVDALNANTGTLLWSYSSALGTDAAPVVANGVVYFSAGTGNNETYALNAKTGALLWSYSTQNNQISAPIVVNGMVYFGADKLYAFHLPSTTPTPKWGVDSYSHITKSFYNSVTATYGAPDFWGRYIGNNPGFPNDMDLSEARFAHSHKFAILPIYFNYAPSAVNGYTTGQAYATAALEDAQRRLKISQGAAIFNDIEESSGVNPDAQFIQGWYDQFNSTFTYTYNKKKYTYLAGYYKAGYYGNGTSTSRFATAYCSAVSAEAQIGTNSFIWSSEPSSSRTSKTNAPPYGPYAPSCAGQTLAWQYAIQGNGGPPSVDIDEALANLPLWHP